MIYTEINQARASLYQVKQKFNQTLQKSPYILIIDLVLQSTPTLVMAGPGYSAIAS